MFTWWVWYLSLLRTFEERNTVRLPIIWDNLQGRPLQYIDLDMDKGLGVEHLSHTQVGSLDSGELWQPEESSSIPVLNTSKESPCTSKESPCQFSTASRSEEPHLLLCIILYFLRSLIFWRNSDLHISSLFNRCAFSNLVRWSIVDSWTLIQLGELYHSLQSVHELISFKVI
jgi:hypothetical protein